MIKRSPFAIRPKLRTDTKNALKEAKLCTKRSYLSTTERSITGLEKDKAKEMMALAKRGPLESKKAISYLQALKKKGVKYVNWSPKEILFDMRAWTPIDRFIEMVQERSNARTQDASDRRLLKKYLKK